MRDGIVGTESRSNKFLERVPGDVPSGSFFDGCEGAIFILWTSPSEMYLRILKASCVIPSFELRQRLELVQPLVIFLAFLAPKSVYFDGQSSRRWRGVRGSLRLSSSVRHIGLV